MSCSFVPCIKVMVVVAVEGIVMMMLLVGWNKFPWLSETEGEVRIVK